MRRRESQSSRQPERNARLEHLDTRSLYLAAYDVAAPRRLRRVHRFLCGYAVPVRYSVFATRCTPMKLGTLRAGLAQFVDTDDDDVHIYPIPEPAVLTIFGKKALPEGLRVIDEGSTLCFAPSTIFASRRCEIRQ